MPAAIPMIAAAAVTGALVAAEVIVAGSIAASLISMATYLVTSPVGEKKPR